MFRRILLRTILALAALAALALVAALSYRAYRQHVIAEATAIRGPDGIDEGMYVRIGGIDQWIQIRGWSRANPVLLVVHGGPGGSWLALTPLLAEWEKHFTVVLWDQRGAGRTLQSTGPSIASTMTVERMTRDGIEVAEYLRSHLHGDKVILLGHSFGSILGVRMIAERPDLFAAYVGTGQVVDMPRAVAADYARLMHLATEHRDEKSLSALRAAGSPPFSSMEQAGHFFSVVNRYESDGPVLPQIFRTALTAPGISLYDLYEVQAGFTRVPTWSIYHEVFSTKLTGTTQFAVPVFFIQGADDDVTPAPLVAEYFESIQAPHKEIVMLPGVGHYAVWIQRDRLLQELVNRFALREPGTAATAR